MSKTPFWARELHILHNSGPFRSKSGQKVFPGSKCFLVQNAFSFKSRRARQKHSEPKNSFERKGSLKGKPFGSKNRNPICGRAVINSDSWKSDFLSGGKKTGAAFRRRVGPGRPCLSGEGEMGAPNPAKSGTFHGPGRAGRERKIHRKP